MLDEIEWNDKEDIHIKQWIDYSNKYGIGYILTNQSCGTYFNDNSKIILYPDNQTLFYRDHKRNTKNQNEIYNINKYPEALKKKVTLLLHFKSYMECQNKNQHAIPFK